MRNYYTEMPDGYTESIQNGLAAARTLCNRFSDGTGSREERIAGLRAEIRNADAIVVGAGAGLSTAAGFTYSGERFEKYFSDFEETFGFHDMYSGGFIVAKAKPETMWAYWARHIYINRYTEAPVPVYGDLLKLLEGKDHFVITTNVDHQFQRAGFDKKRLFYTQGDYGLFQRADGLIKQTYDNEEWTMKAMEAQGFVRDKNGVFQPPENGRVSMSIPVGLIPAAPDGAPVKMNLRSDDSFVEDAGWRRASAAYSDFLSRHKDLHVLYMEIGVGANTPVIIKFPFWQMTRDNKNAVYACLNYNEAYCPEEIEKRSICINGDFADVLKEL